MKQVQDPSTLHALHQICRLCTPENKETKLPKSVSKPPAPRDIILQGSSDVYPLEYSESEDDSSGYESFDSDAYVTSSSASNSSASSRDLSSSESTSDVDDVQAGDLTSSNTVLKPVVKRKGRPGRPRAPQGSKADTPRNAQRRRRAQQKRREDRLERDWRAAVLSRDDQLADELYQELLPTVRGRHLFPSQTKTATELKAFQGLG